MFLRTGLPPRAVKRSLTVHELHELRTYCSAYPIDDEANVWLPSALLRSQLANMLRAPDSPIVDALDYMPFRDKTDDESEQDPGQMLMDNWSKW